MCLTAETGFRSGRKRTCLIDSCDLGQGHEGNEYLIDRGSWDLGMTGNDVELIDRNTQISVYMSAHSPKTMEGHMVFM